MKSITPSLSTSSLTKPKKEQNVEIAVIIAPQSPAMPANIKNAIDEQVQGKTDQASVIQEPQKVEEEQREANNEDFDQKAPKEEPIMEFPILSWRVHSDRVDSNGKVTHPS